MKKALMYASVASIIQQFNMNNIRNLQALGYKVDVACNFEFGSSISHEKVNQLKQELKVMDVDFYHVPVPRKLGDIKNSVKSYRKTRTLMNRKNYDLIHCHSPIGGIICRVAYRTSKNYKNGKMIYTAHGFHFFEGNSKIKNIIFSSVEKIGAKFTDTLITINMEDYNAAQKFKLRNKGRVEHVPGVGIDLDKIEVICAERNKLLEKLGVPEESKLLLSVGELNENKNHRIVIEALPYLDENVHYIICGQGHLKEELATLAKSLKVDSRVHLLGFQNNIIEIMKSCDIFVFPSKREGLSVALMEAMACGMPCVVSKIRGNSELIDEGKGGSLFEISDTNVLSGLISELIDNKEINKIKEYNLQKIRAYSRKQVDSQMRKIYLEN